jgi:hypothetical protein
MTKRSRWFCAAVALLILPMLTGCMCVNTNLRTVQEFDRDAYQNAPASTKYWGDRLHDFMDLWRIQWGVPRDFMAFGAKVKFTALAEAGIVYFKGSKVGMERRAVGIIRQDKIEAGITPVYFTGINEEPACGNVFMDPNIRWNKIRDRRIIRNGVFWSDGTKRPASIGFEIQFFCFGGPDFQFYFCEFGDFLAGWFGIDPRGDDCLLMDSAEADNAFFRSHPAPPEPVRVQP